MIADPVAFGAALRQVRAHRRMTLRDAERYLGSLTDRPPDRWSKSKIEQAEKGERLDERWVLRYLSAHGIPGPELPPWVMALRRALGVSPARPPALSPAGPGAGPSGGSEPGGPLPGGPQPARIGPLISNLEPRNRLFTGRDRVLGTLHARLRSDEAAAVVGAGADGEAGRGRGSSAGVGVEAVHGLGGVGKSELVREFAHRFAGDYELIWWIPAEQPTAAAASVAALAHPLGVPESVHQADTIAAVFAELRNRQRWLLVYDNAEHPDALGGLVPSIGAGHVVVTSRWRAWAETAHPVRLDVFDRAESVRYLTRRNARLDDDRADSAPAVLDPAPAQLGELAEMLGDLPLALAEAAAYLEHTQLGVEAYLRLLRERARDLFGLGATDPADGASSGWTGDARRVATLWSLSLERVREQAPAAEALLTLFAFLAPDDVPRTLVPSHPEVISGGGGGSGDRHDTGLADVVIDPLRYNHALAVLGRYSMITLGPDSIGVHRLVQAVVRARLRIDTDPATERRWVAVTTSLLRAAFPAGDVREPAVWSTCARLLPHLLAVTDHAEHHRTALADAGWLLGRASKHLRERGQYSQALPLADRALADTTAALGAECPEVADRHDELGRALEETGELEAARRECQEAVRIGLAVLGPDHADLGHWRQTLGRVFWRSGEAAEAHREWQEALRIGLATLGPDHPDVGRRRNNVAFALMELGEPSAARREVEEALRIGLAALGPDHPTIVNWRDSLGLVLRELGEWEAARRECEEAVRISVATLGPDHPTTGVAHDSLGLVLRDLGEWTAARRACEEAVRIGLASLGPDHPLVGGWRSNLALVLRDLGVPAAARRELQEALRVSGATLGPDHPRTDRIRARLDEAAPDPG